MQATEIHSMLDDLQFKNLAILRKKCVYVQKLRLINLLCVDLVTYYTFIHNE